MTSLRQTVDELVAEIDRARADLGGALTTAQAELDALRELSEIIGDDREDDASELDARIERKQVEVDTLLIAHRLVFQGDVLDDGRVLRVLPEQPDADALPPRDGA